MNINTNQTDEMECLKIDYGQLTNELEKSKALNDIQKKNFIDEIEKVSDSKSH